MKCNHCNGEHPDDFKYCPITTKEIALPMISCSNPECVNLGKYILPIEARFCPKCGRRLVNELYEWERHCDNCARVIDTFFPVLGKFNLGKTTIEEVEKLGYRLDYRNEDLYAWTRLTTLKSGPGPLIARSCSRDVFTVIGISVGQDIFPEWKNIGFNWENSYNDWVQFFKKMNFKVIQMKAPKVNSRSNFEASFVGIASDNSIKFLLNFFCIGNCNNATSQGTLCHMSVYHPYYEDYDNIECWYLSQEPAKLI